jgi:hypothetical protein
MSVGPEVKKVQRIVKSIKCSIVHRSLSTIYIPICTCAQCFWSTVCSYVCVQCSWCAGDRSSSTIFLSCVYSVIMCVQCFCLQCIPMCLCSVFGLQCVPMCVCSVRDVLETVLRVQSSWAVCTVLLCVCSVFVYNVFMCLCILDFPTLAPYLKKNWIQNVPPRLQMPPQFCPTLPFWLTLSLHSFAISPLIL